MEYVQEPYNYTKGNFIKTEYALMNIGNLRFLYSWGEQYFQTGDEGFLQNITDRFLLNNTNQAY